VWETFLYRAAMLAASAASSLNTTLRATRAEDRQEALRIAKRDLLAAIRLVEEYEGDPPEENSIGARKPSGKLVL
jgi:hypothetical protein